jgi:predicted secreted protein
MFPRYVLSLVLVLCCAGVYAGDNASFVDLGFSTDGRRYMFGQYGVTDEDHYPWAQAIAIDTFRNDYLPGGRIDYTYPTAARPGQDGSGALFRLLHKHPDIAAKNGINYLTKGDLIYFDAGGDSGEVSFSDLGSGSNYLVQLFQNVKDEGADLKSMFTLKVQRTNPLGVSKEYRGGSPTVWRKGVESYRIHRVFTAPKDLALIFVIEMKVRNGDDEDIRYMVESVRL